MKTSQREMARHALGLPNKKRMTNRNHYCIGKGGDGYEAWEDLVATGLAIKRSGPHWGGDDMFHLLLEGARQALCSNEHISREDAVLMRDLAEQNSGIIYLTPVRDSCIIGLWKTYRQTRYKLFGTPISELSTRWKRAPPGRANGSGCIEGLVFCNALSITSTLGPLSNRTLGAGSVIP